MKKLDDLYLDARLAQVVILSIIAIIPWGMLLAILVGAVLLLQLFCMFLNNARDYYKENYIIPLERAEMAARKRLDRNAA